MPATRAIWSWPAPSMAGNAWAIAETWHRFAPAVIMLARRALGSESEAEDLAQEVFQRRVRQGRDPARARSAAQLHLLVRDSRCSRPSCAARRTRAWLSFHRPETLVDLGGELTDMESRDLLRRFYALLDRLAPRHRLVFVLRHLESMTVEEVAAHMEISISTVKRALERATSKLSRWIEADPGPGRILRRAGVAPMTDAGREQGTARARRPWPSWRAAACGRRRPRELDGGLRALRARIDGGRAGARSRRSILRWSLVGTLAVAAASSAVVRRPFRRTRARPRRGRRSPTGSRAAASSTADTCASRAAAASSCSSPRGRSSS